MLDLYLYCFNDAMTTQIITIESTGARQLFDKNQIRHILVVDENKLVGIRVSFEDIYGDDQATVDYAIVNMLTVKDVMRYDPIFISPNSSIEDAIFVLLNRRFHSLPVVENDRVVGIVTTTDFLKLLVESVQH